MTVIIGMHLSGPVQALGFSRATSQFADPRASAPGIHQPKSALASRVGIASHGMLGMAAAVYSLGTNDQHRLAFPFRD